MTVCSWSDGDRETVSEGALRDRCDVQNRPLGATVKSTHLCRNVTACHGVYFFSFIETASSFFFPGDNISVGVKDNRQLPLEQPRPRIGPHSWGLISIGFEAFQPIGLWGSRNGSCEWRGFFCLFFFYLAAFRLSVCLCALLWMSWDETPSLRMRCSSDGTAFALFNFRILVDRGSKSLL